MTGKIVGVGWAKTGTTSLGVCLKTLGFNHVGGQLDLVDHLRSSDLGPVLPVLDEYDSAEDWPWLLLYRDIDTAFPGSKFVLTTREPAAWLRSYRNMVAGQATSPVLERRREVLYGFNPGQATDETLVARIAEHNAAVREYFHGRPHDLLEVDWSRGDGWAELCGFLGVPIPPQGFPHANAGTYSTPVNIFRRGMSKARSVATRALR